MTFHTDNRFLNSRLINHLIFWILFVFIGSFIFSYQQNYPYVFYLLNFIVNLPVFISYTYFVVYILVHYFLLKGRYLMFFCSLSISTALASFIKLLTGKYVYYSLFIPKILHPKEWFSLDAFLINLMWIIGPAVLFAMFKYYKNWMKSQDIANEAERKHLASELQVLKAQLNPHFLFNTFNNIYVLALNKSDKTPVVVAKMSDMFHYILYECNAIEVPLSKEIKLIEDYIELELLRYTDRLSINFEKDVDDYHFLVPPMLLYTFVENCFKHGCSPDPDLPWIKILIRVKNNCFVFEASNSIPEVNNNKKETSVGVGLLNIRRRLELIYSGNHQLMIQSEKDKFYVKLIIQKKIQTA